ncbi:MAG TPA: hotdog fold domain-containing protein, partial [Methylomirabilota bacterium]|nr:hotdog fold domain-containing protein [Methylomirabilota bacterium]
MQEALDSPRRWCFGCGEANPEGLHIQFQIEGRRATGEFEARPVHQGYPGVAHGGIAAAAIDEAMGWAMYAAGAWAMTARLEVKYRRPLPLGEPLEVTAEVLKDRGRWLEAEGEL